MTRSEILQVAKPILFKEEMIQAILEGRKTVTRRTVKGVPDHAYRAEPVNLYGDGTVYAWDFLYGELLPGGGCADMYETIKPYYQRGDFLYVRETWERFDCSSCDGDEAGLCFNGPPDSREGCYVYRASHSKNGDARWRPSVHMPKEAARIFLQVTGVRVEKLNEISVNEIAREGIQAEYMIPAFHEFWDSTIAPKDREKYDWKANPYVWVFSFERII